MTMALVAKNKLCFVDGSIERLMVDVPIYNLWSRCNNMVMSWILHSVSKDIAKSGPVPYRIFSIRIEFVS